MSKTSPKTRGFTLADRDGLKFELYLLYAIGGVALSSFIISFAALAWVGEEAMGLHVWAFGLGLHLIVPLAIDGMQLVAAAAITRRRANGKPAGAEWIALASALALSIAGNVYHALEVGNPGISSWLKVAFASAFPIFVALGMHIYERAMADGLRSKIAVDDTDHIIVDTAPAPAVTRPQRTRPAPPVEKPTEKSTPPPLPAPAPQDTTDTGPSPKEQVHAHVRAELDAAGTFRTLDAAQVQRDTVGDDVHPSTVRKWVRHAEAEWQADNPKAERDLANAGQLTAAERSA